jgi:hypothetical protein
LKLLKDVMDRTEGTPKSSVDLSSEDGSFAPSTVRIEAVAGKSGKDE